MEELIEKISQFVGHAPYCATYTIGVCSCAQDRRVDAQEILLVFAEFLRSDGAAKDHIRGLMDTDILELIARQLEEAAE